MKEKINCLVCGNEFEVSPSRNNRKFCSQKCMGEHQSKNNIGENSHSWKEKVKITCQNCNKNFEVNLSRKDTAKYCSNKCRGIYRSKNYYGKNHSNWKGGKIKKECLICGIKFECKSYQNDTAKLCSHKCRAEYQSKNYSGKNSSAWEGGKSFEPYCEKFNNHKKEEIRNQYGRKCYICGRDEKDNITKTGKIRKLSVHHIDMDKEQGCNGKSWKLVPLCIHCHNSNKMKVL